MGFVSLFFVYLIIILVIVCCSTFTAIILLVVAALLKRGQKTKKRNAEMEGNPNYKISKLYLIPKILGFVCMIPLTLCVILVLYAVIDVSVDERTSLSYNVLNADTEAVEKIIDSGVSPDCTGESNDAAGNGEKTLLYSLAAGTLENENFFKDESVLTDHEKKLEMMELLIEKGADVNYVTYKHDKDCADHVYQGDTSIYSVTDQCGWTPLMMATYKADFDMIKLLVENGADVNAVDYCGYNVIDIVADNLDDENGYEILLYYLDLGVDPNNVTNYSQNALWLASRQTAANEKILSALMDLE